MKIFPNATGMFERYHELRHNEPYRNKREKYLTNYMRWSWRRSVKGSDQAKQDPNFGQFRAKIDTAVGTFTQVLTERPMSVKIVPRYVEKGLQKRISEAISSAFHRHFIKPWEDRFIIDCHAAFDMVMSAKAIEYWPNPYCIYSENIPVERVFPDTNAGHNVKKWNYVFVEVDYTINQLEAMMDESEEMSKKMPKEGEEKLIIFKHDYLRKILDNPEIFERSQSTERETTKRTQGDISQGNRDFSIPIVHLYAKDLEDKEKKVSLYCFPAEFNVPNNASQSIKDKYKSIELLYEQTGYSECISQTIANRTYLMSRNWYSCESFAEQIYLATVLYDKTMSLLIRAAKRNSILYFTSDNPSSVAKLLKQNDDEVQHIPRDAAYVTTQQNTALREIMETTRQVMIDTENGQSLAQAPGSQNVKGYAITAEEAGIRARAQGETEQLNIKMLMSMDIALWKEIYRRVMENKDPAFKKAMTAFRKEMKALNIKDSDYSFDNVYFAPSFLNGGSQLMRIQNAQGVAQALAIDPKNPGQLQAQRDLVGAYVGTDNIENYISDERLPSPAAVKAGMENQALDDLFVNPANIPVLPDDLHLQEVPIHLQDYALKLDMAMNLMKTADATQNVFMKLMYFSMARDLIVAQDNKGGHIQAHLQAVEASDVNKITLNQILPQYKQLQQRQDQMVEQVTGVLQELEKSMATSDLNNEKLRHQQAMAQLTEAHAKAMNDINLEKSLQQRQASLDRTADKRDADLESTGIKLAAKEQETQLKLKQQEDAIKAKREETSASTSQSSQGGTAA